MTPTLYIDPGAAGGFAWRDTDGVACAEKMPDGMAAQNDFLRDWAISYRGDAVIEDVGTYMPGNSGPAAVAFGRHIGNLESGLYMISVSTRKLPPAKWMRQLGVPVFPPAERPDGLDEKALKKWKTADAARRKKLRKGWIKETVARAYPHLRVTDATADALGMMLSEERGAK